jgi:hypothetical protein
LKNEPIETPNQVKVRCTPNQGLKILLEDLNFELHQKRKFKEKIIIFQIKISCVWPMHAW